MSNARALVEQRSSTFFRAGLVSVVATNLRIEEGLLSNTQLFSVTSNHFEVRGRLRLDDLALEELSTLKRDGRNVTISSRRRTTVTTPEPGGLDYTSLQGQFGQ